MTQVQRPHGLEISPQHGGQGSFPEEVMRELRFAGITFMNVTDVPILEESLCKSPVAGGSTQRARDRPVCLERQEKTECGMS